MVDSDGKQMSNAAHTKRNDQFMEMDAPERTLPPLVPVLIVALVLAGAIAAFVMKSRPKPAATASMTKISSVQPSEGRVLVGIELNIRNTYEKAIYIHTLEVKCTTPTGDYSDTPAAAADLPRYFKAYPDVASDKTPLIDNVKVEPGQQVNGYILVAFPIPKDDFDKRKSLQTTINLYDQNPIVVKEAK